MSKNKDLSDITTENWSGRRKGYIYSEFTNKGRSSVRYAKGCAPVACYRWVAEIQIMGKRYRCRSKDRSKCEAWLNDMVAKQEVL